MPKQIKELRKFMSGTISSASSTDIPDDAPVFSINIDPQSEEGKLKGNKKAIRKTSSATIQTFALDVYNDQYTGLLGATDYLAITVNGITIRSEVDFDSGEAWENTSDEYRQTHIFLNFAEQVNDNAVGYKIFPYRLSGPAGPEDPSEDIWIEAPDNFGLTMVASLGDDPANTTINVTSITSDIGADPLYPVPGNPDWPKLDLGGQEFIKYNDEVMRILSWDATANTIEVERAKHSSTIQAHAGTENAYIRGGYRHFTIEFDDLFGEDFLAGVYLADGTLKFEMEEDNSTQYLLFNPKKSIFINEKSEELEQIKNDLVYFSITEDDVSDLSYTNDEGTYIEILENSYKIKVAENFYEENESPLTITDNNYRIPNTPETVTMEKNANAVYIGTGNQANASPQWFGKIEHDRFGIPHEGYTLLDAELDPIDKGDGIFSLNYKEYFLSGDQAASFDSTSMPVADQIERFLIATSRTSRHLICINNQPLTTGGSDQNGAIGSHFKSENSLGDYPSAFHQSNYIFSKLALTSPLNGQFTNNDWVSGTGIYQHETGQGNDKLTSYAWLAKKGDPSNLMAVALEITDTTETSAPGTTEDFEFDWHELCTYSLRHGITTTAAMNLNVEEGTFIERPPKSGSYISDIYELNPGNAATTKVYILYSHPGGFSFDDEWLYVFDPSTITSAAQTIELRPVTPPAMKLKNFGKGNSSSSSKKTLYMPADVFNGDGLGDWTHMGFNGARKIYSNKYRWRNCDQLGHLAVNAASGLTEAPAGFTETADPDHVSDNSDDNWQTVYAGDDDGAQAKGVDTKWTNFPGMKPNEYDGHGSEDFPHTTNSNDPHAQTMGHPNGFGNNDMPNVKDGWQDWGTLFGWQEDEGLLIEPVDKGLFRLDDDRMEIGCLTYVKGKLSTHSVELNHAWRQQQSNWGYQGYHAFHAKKDPTFVNFDEVVVMTANHENLGVRQRCVPRNYKLAHDSIWYNLDNYDDMRLTDNKGAMINGDTGDGHIQKNHFRCGGFYNSLMEDGSLPTDPWRMKSQHHIYRLSELSGASSQADNDTVGIAPTNNSQIASCTKNLKYYQANNDELMISAAGNNPQKGYIYRWTPTFRSGGANSDTDMEDSSISNPHATSPWTGATDSNPLKIFNIGPPIITDINDPVSSSTKIRLFCSPISGLHQNGFVRYHTDSPSYDLVASNAVTGYSELSYSPNFYKTEGGDLPVGMLIEFESEVSDVEDPDGDGVDTYTPSNFNDDVNYFWKVTMVYDGYQEGPMTDFEFVATPAHGSGKNYKNAKLTLYIEDPPRRVNALAIYRKNSAEEFYRFVAELSLEKQWVTDQQSGFKYKIVHDVGTLGASYQAVTGMPESLRNTIVNYKLSTAAQGHMIVADCWHPDIQNAQNFLFKSQPNSFSSFDWAKDFCVLPDVPTVIQWWAGKIYAFDLANTYVINLDTLALEDTFEGVGCMGPDSILVTDVGMFFCDYSGMYWHNGQKTENIGKDIYGDASQVNDFNWHDVDHKDEDGNYIAPKVLYDARTSSVIFAFSHSGVHKAWVMALTRKRWDLMDIKGNYGRLTGSRNDIYISDGNGLWELYKDENRNPYDFYSKGFDFGNSSVEKKIVKFKVVFNNSTEATEWFNKVETNNAFSMYCDDVELTFKKTKEKNIVIFRFSGSERKGFIFKFRIRNTEEEIDSVSMIYTVGSIK